MRNFIIDSIKRGEMNNIYIPIHIYIFSYYCLKRTSYFIRKMKVHVLMLPGFVQSSKTIINHLKEYNNVYLYEHKVFECGHLFY